MAEKKDGEARGSVGGDRQGLKLPEPTIPAGPKAFPIVPLRDCAVFPGMVVPLNIGRKGSVAALEKALSGADQAAGEGIQAAHGPHVVLVPQRDSSVDAPSFADLAGTGSIAQVVRANRRKDGTFKVLVKAICRVHVLSSSMDGDAMFGRVVEMPDLLPPKPEAEALANALKDGFQSYLLHTRRLPLEMLQSLATIDSLGRMTDTIAGNLSLKADQRLALLETAQVSLRVERLLDLMEYEKSVADMERKIRGRVKQQMDKSQREYFLNEQIHAIQKELGEKDEFKAELDELKDKIRALNLPEEAAAKADRELKKLKSMSPMSPEATVVRNYLDWICDLPWGKCTAGQPDIAEAEKVLEEDHYGLEKVKERILEHLAVQALSGHVKGPILCFVGPPGVGKTSLGKSIARATGRRFVRLALGGVKDEAEIRGHRRTYIGAMPGKILKSFKKAGSADPVFLLDEVDKLSSDYRGDPSSALLEVLDPEQNGAFNDHYLDMDYDLSKAMFICTANTLDGIPGPLRDRLEIIRLSGYTDLEKRSIARKYLIPKMRRENGLDGTPFELSDEALGALIGNYTREAGVRSLERAISKICRKVACRIMKDHSPKDAPVSVGAGDLEGFLGPKVFTHGEIEKEDQVGLVTGLAWTELGGELLVTEATLMPGKGKVTITGQLGDVMQESAQAAMSYVRSRAARFGIGAKAFENLDLHIHVPEGAIPKDGPSAGITMATTMVSAYTRIPVRRDVAMTGEITLRGRVLPIGGLKEKALAAHRGGIRTVIIPADNVKDLKEIPESVLKELTVVPVEHLDQVLKVALKLDDPESFIRCPDEMVTEDVLALEGAPTPVPGRPSPSTAKKPRAKPASRKAAVPRAGASGTASAGKAGKPAKPASTKSVKKDAPSSSSKAKPPKASSASKVKGKPTGKASKKKTSKAGR